MNHGYCFSTVLLSNIVENMQVQSAESMSEEYASQGGITNPLPWLT